MTGCHDVGGMQPAGPICTDGKSLGTFGQEWQAQALSLTLASGMLGNWNIDAARYERECVIAEATRDLHYYEIWMAALANLLVNTGLVAASDLRNPTSEGGDYDHLAVKPDYVAGILDRGGPAAREDFKQATFCVGQPVKTRRPHANRFQTNGHTRLPSYAQDKKGIILQVRGTFVLPDSNAHFLGECPEHLYSVRFSATELWGEEAEAGGDHVILDLWESYMEPA